MGYVLHALRFTHTQGSHTHSRVLRTMEGGVQGTSTPSGPMQGFTCPCCTIGQRGEPPCELSKVKVSRMAKVVMFKDPSSAVLYGISKHGPTDVSKWFDMDLAPCIYKPNKGKSVEYNKDYNFFRAMDERFSNAVVCSPCAMQSFVYAAVFGKETTQLSPDHCILSDVFLHSSSKEVQ